MVCKMLRLLIKTLNVDGKFCLINRDNLMEPIEIIIYAEKNFFLELFFAFSESKLNFEHFQKTMTLIPHVFPKLRTPKNVVI